MSTTPLKLPRTLSGAILAVGSYVDEKGETPGNRAEFFNPKDNIWKDAGEFRDIFSVSLSPMVYFDGMFILFGGQIKRWSDKNLQYSISTNSIMSLDENNLECSELDSVGHCWRSLGELSQEQSKIGIKAIFIFGMISQYSGWSK